MLYTITKKIDNAVDAVVTVVDNLKFPMKKMTHLYSWDNMSLIMILFLFIFGVFFVFG